jgi:hypothetical protein
MIKWLMSCVLPGVEDILANFFDWQSMFIREDFPTLDLPINAYSGLLGGGHLLASWLLVKKRAVLIIVFLQK